MSQRKVTDLRTIICHEHTQPVVHPRPDVPPFGCLPWGIGVVVISVSSFLAVFESTLSCFSCVCVSTSSCFNLAISVASNPSLRLLPVSTPLICLLSACQLTGSSAVREYVQSWPLGNRGWRQSRFESNQIGSID